MLSSVFHWIPIVISGLITVTTANPLGSALPVGYTLSEKPLEWDVPIAVDGPTVKQWGTVQQVRANMTANYPGWNDAFPVRSFDDLDPSNFSSAYTQTDYKCNNYGACNREKIVDGINYLMSVPGQPRMDPGPGKCIRVSCSWNAGIFMCNDNTHEYRLNSFKDISSAGYFLYDACRHNPVLGTMAGQVWYKENWNTVIRWDKC
ncbi:hypothetical protein QBC43DRAFT_339620 [Cladorrhinum sp. PSN259]|nr:hypothetical protein QBC43DRAFT_339620 [Cladorrhinum sp. PSN259]